MIQKPLKNSPDYKITTDVFLEF